MATRKSYIERPSYIYFGDNSITSDNQFEFDEADVWNSSEVVQSEPKKSIPNSRSSKKPTRKGGPIDRRSSPIAAATSLPVNIPEWSKILRDEYNKNRRREKDDDVDGDDDDDDDEDARMPPHVYLARTRTASLSVHEGIGRTLKGRDLSRVRNAIWKQTGFED